MRLLRALLPAFLTLFLLTPTDAWATYAQTTPVLTRFTDLRGNACIVARWTETGVGSTSEASVTLDWQIGTIVSVRQLLTPGTASTLHTLVGRDPGFTASTMPYIAAANATAAFINEQNPVVFYAPQKILYLHAGPNAGSDNTVGTELIACGAVLW